MKDNILNRAFFVVDKAVARSVARMHNRMYALKIIMNEVRDRKLKADKISQTMTNLDVEPTTIFDNKKLN